MIQICAAVFPPKLSHHASHEPPGMLHVTLRRGLDPDVGNR